MKPSPFEVAFYFRCASQSILRWPEILLLNLDRRFFECHRIQLPCLGEFRFRRKSLNLLLRRNCECFRLRDWRRTYLFQPLELYLIRPTFVVARAKVARRRKLTRYNLDEVFRNREANPSVTTLSNPKENIPEDSFVHSKEYKDYEVYRILEREVEAAISKKTDISLETLKALQMKNPEYWKAYYLTGKYYFGKNYDAAAKRAFETALTKEITTVPDKERIKKYLRKIKH